MIDIGVNLAAINYWSTQEPFIDHFHTSGSWLARSSTGSDVTTSLTYASDGDPIYSSSVTSLSVAVGVDPKSAPTTDQYVLTYDGTAKVSIANATIVSQTAGKVVFNYIGGDSKPDVYITFKSLNASDPVGDVHLVRADQVDEFNAGEIFNPAFLEKVSEWGVVRFMDWGNTNESNALTWATRTTLDDNSWQLKADGVPLEAMVKLANEAHVDMWYNVPTKADDAYVQNALTYIRDHLDPSLKVHVEWSNEVWNTSFKANSYAQSQANALWGNGTVVSHGANIYYGYRSAQISDIAHDVFTGTHAGQLVEVLGSQAASSSMMTYMAQGIAKAGLGSVSDLFDEYAIAPYFGAELGQAVKAEDEATILGWAQSGAAGLDAAFKELEFGGTLHADQSLAVVSNWITKSGSIANQYGLDLAAYEGGISLGTVRFDPSVKATIQDFFNRLLDDPRMGDLYTKMVNKFIAAGGDSFLAFNDTGTPGDSGSFGMLDSIYSDGSARYDSLLAFSTASTFDFNGDQHSDIIWRNANGAVTGWGVTGDVHADQLHLGLFNAGVGLDWHIQDVFDCDGDGRADVLWRNDNGEVQIWKAVGSGFQMGAFSSDSAGNDWRVAATGDFNGDGKDDILWRHESGALSEWTSASGNFGQGLHLVQNAYNRAPIGTDWHVLGAADFNADGRDDILWRNDNGTVSLWTSNGSGFAEGVFQAGVGRDWHVAGLGDFDGDGRADILWRNDNGAVTTWLSNGTSFNQDRFNASAGTDWKVATVGDFNGDGRDDVLWRNDNGAVTMWQSNGHGFDMGIINTGASTDWSIVGYDGLF